MLTSRKINRSLAIARFISQVTGCFGRLLCATCGIIAQLLPAAEKISGGAVCVVVLSKAFYIAKDLGAQFALARERTHP